MAPKVSIVVPIYGVEKYLHQCIDSILAQTLKEIEIILVDDGSPDTCPQIIDEYAKKDLRIIAVHQSNGGYGRAVNHGIELANGEYIGIIESDDWIEPDMFEKLYFNAKKNNTDITKGGFWRYDSTLPKEKQNMIWSYNNQNLFDAPHAVFTIEEYPLLMAFHASIWSSIYRADFIKQIKVNESKSASYQDFPFMIEALCKAKRISVVHKPFVHYRMEAGQNSSTIRRDKRLILMPEQCIIGKKILKSSGKYQILKEAFYFHAYLACYGFYQNIYWKYKREYLKKYQELMSEIDESFTYKYFTPEQIKICKNIQKGNLINSLIDFKILRRFLCSMHISKRGFCIQILGVKISKGPYVDRPALFSINIKS